MGGTVLYTPYSRCTVYKGRVQRLVYALYAQDLFPTTALVGQVLGVRTLVTSPRDCTLSSVYPAGYGVPARSKEGIY